MKSQFFNSGHDVVISGIDTTEALVQAKKSTDAGFNPAKTNPNGSGPRCTPTVVGVALPWA